MREDVKVGVHIDASPSRVWDALTNPAKLKDFFFGSDVITDWKVGAPIRFRGEWKGKTYEDRGTIVAFEPPRLLSYTHWSPLSGTEDRPENYHQVAFELQPLHGGTQVTLIQSSVDSSKAPAESARADFAKNWEKVLDGLKRVVEA
jgi:uncharacterized protein YndB with AHSA1/START domain